MKEHTNQLSRTAYRSQLKEHKKLYKSGKTWMVATLLTVGLAGGAAVTGTTNAHADEVSLPKQLVRFKLATKQLTQNLLMLNRTHKSNNQLLTVLMLN